ncbi:TerB family tellurite resistance protein [Rhodovibrionaceae bacterium A322]
MIDRIKAFFSDTGKETLSQGDQDQVAAAALLVTAARMDSDFAETERARIELLVAERFGLDAQETRQLLEMAEVKAEESNQLFGFTRVIMDHFELEQRISLLEMLWEVIYADGRVDDLEAALMRRLVGLLGVSDRDSGLARKRAREKLGLAD